MYRKEDVEEVLMYCRVKTRCSWNVLIGKKKANVKRPGLFVIKFTETCMSLISEVHVQYVSIYRPMH